MCGIAGVAGEIDSGRATHSVSVMLRALARRGPDGEGVEAWEGAVLGHRRLAVFDLSDAGRQPMLSPNRRIAVTFNGAIYNFHELRRELEQLGYRFASRTDTEVLVHGYDAWGIDSLVSKLAGMFAFALWDARAKSLYLVRDRLGVKPLLYVQRGKTLAFASTARALCEAGFAGELDASAVGEFLEFGFVTDQRAIFEGVCKLPAAHVACWRNGDLSVRPYWFPNAPGASRVRFSDAVEETERLLLQAVERRLEADVPVGALLSGGIDSALVCWAIRRLGGDVTAYTVSTPGDPYDESAAACETAQELGVKHCLLPVDARTAPSIDELVGAFAEPFACASALGMLAVSKAIKRHATVLLTGDGGDDVFLGYPRHAHYAAAARLARALPPGSARAWKGVRKLLPAHGVFRRAAHFLDYATGGLGAIAAVGAGLPFYRSRGMLGERLQGLVPHSARYTPSAAAGRRALDDFLEYERATRFVGEYMTKVDGATMYYALEARSPFLDHALWEYASALPHEVRLHGGVLKAILREIARRRIGERVAGGAKRGFGVPIERWIVRERRRELEEAFSDSVLADSGWIDSRAVLRSVRTLPEGSGAPQQLWYLFVLERWMRRQRLPGAPAARAAGN